MLLQEIFNKKYKETKEIYGIEINSTSNTTEFSRPPKNFETIGFNLKLGEDNLIDEDLLDIIINYKLTNMFIVIEVPSQLIKENVITPKTLIQLSSNVDFAISLLPPNHPLVGDSITQEDYIQIIKSFNDEMMKKQNFDKFVAPISNFMEYLMLEKLLGKDHSSIKNFTPDNEYVKNTFSQYMTYEESNAFKDVLRQSLYDFYGGQEQFDIVASAMFDGIYNKTKDVFYNHVTQYVEENKQKQQAETELENKADANPESLEDK